MSSFGLTHSDDCPCSRCSPDTPRDGEIEEEPEETELPERQVPEAWNESREPEGIDPETGEPRRTTPWD